MGLEWLIFLIGPLYLIDGSMSKHHKDTCLKEIGLRLQIFIIYLHSIMNTFEKTNVSG